MERGFFSFISTKRVAQSTLETISVEAIVTGPITLIGEIKLDTMSCSAHEAWRIKVLQMGFHDLSLLSLFF